VIISVEMADSGSGIPPEIQSRIFEPFFTTKQVGKGSGLGLETAQRIIENRHQGTIFFESKPGRTCFCVCLPFDQPQELTAPVKY
jgi:signal transduction histidine kinase